MPLCVTNEPITLVTQQGHVDWSPQVFPSDAVDDAGLLLPDAGWPADRAAPGDLEVVRRYVNTTNLESGAERWRTPNAVTRWLADEGHAEWDVTADDIGRMVDLRELLRDLATANHDDTIVDVPEPSVLDDLRHGVRLDTGHLVSTPTGTGVYGLMECVVGIAIVATADGTWQRLKACRNHGCRWAYYDRSRNQRGRWCSMRTCGGRRKARAYRARTSPVAAAPSPDRRVDR